MATDSKASSHRHLRSARLRAQKEALSTGAEELTFEKNVSSISLDCRNHRLISVKTYQRIKDASTQKQKVTFLLNAITKQMEESEDCFDLFLYLLEQIDSCRELVKKLKMLLEGAMERNYKAQVARKKKIELSRSTAQFDAQQYAINEHFCELLKVCESLLTAIASICETKKIISKKVYQEASSKSGDKKTKTKKFLESVCLAMRKDSTKFDVFLEVLKNKRSCSEVAAKIESSKESFQCSKNELVIAPEVLPCKQSIGIKPFVTSTECLHAEGEATERPSQFCCGHGIQESATEEISISNSQIDYKRTQELKYQQVMGEKHDQAKELDDLREQNEKMNKEKCEMLFHIDQLNKELLDKKTELRKIEVEKEQLEGEVQTLKIAVDKAKKSDAVKTLKARIAEKEREIEEKNKKIQNLEKQQSDLQKELSEKNSDLESTKEVLQNVRAVLLEFQSFSRANSVENQTIHRQNRCLFFWVIAITFFTIIFSLVFWRINL